MRRKRINRACIASSSNYAESKKAHREYIREEHNKNNVILMSIPSALVKPKTDIEIFEENLKKQIKLFRRNKGINCV
ncbi:hypothetical protein [Fusobacterium ulcerans]|uniref:hypothetical protein n=1 Tax=Fusobacterium ulcerans TaxID=861 RepID=UPI002E7A94EA|nr:hypothetical protein [Fusobacterium ulcerans]MEE0138336.1 hypothetical protein [Fusobacterium ulcerans]